jgi:hypothetical protein
MKSGGIQLSMPEQSTKTPGEQSLRSAVVHRHIVLLFLCSLVLFLAACTAPPAPMLHLDGILRISAPEAIIAGETLAIVIAQQNAPDDLPVTVALSGSAGTQVYRTRFRAGRADLLIPAAQTRRAGMVLISAQADEARGQQSITILPGPAATPLTPLVGPRGVIADEADWSLVTLIPQDALGNLAADGTPIRVRARNPAGILAEQQITSRYGIAWLKIVGGNTAGRIIITAESGDAHGPEAALDAVAGAPISATIQAEPATLPADGRQNLTLRTSVLQDRFGNMVPDGTLVTFLVIAPDGSERRIPATTIGGVAVAPLQAPAEPGATIVIATIGLARSEPLGIIFGDGPAVGRIELQTSIDVEQGLVIVTIGPLLGDLGQLVPDGTPVQLSLIDAGQGTHRITVRTDYGYARAQLRLADFAAGTVVIVATAGAGSGSAAFEVP